MSDQHSDKTAGYHLFLQPTGPLAAELENIIAQLARTYDGPVFTPHVTLLSHIPDENEEELIARSKTLASTLVPLTLTLGELTGEDSYFRALYSKIIEQDKMRSLHEAATSIFSVDLAPDYTAHLSLLYGNYTNEIKDQVQTDIMFPEIRSFVADTLYLYQTHGKVEEWVCVGAFPFGI